MLMLDYKIWPRLYNYASDLIFKPPSLMSYYVLRTGVLSQCVYID